MNPTATPIRTAVILLALVGICVGCGAPGEEASQYSPNAEAEATLEAASDANAAIAQDDFLLVYVGTSTGDPAEGIHAFRFDPSTGGIDSVGLAASVMNPSFLGVSPDGRMLYAVSERSEGGALLAYRIDPATGGLDPVAERDTRGAGPAYVGLNDTGRWIAVANYGGGSVSLFPVDSTGVPGPAADTAVHAGSGPNAERQEGPHAHFAGFGPGDRFVYAVDLGTDEVRIYDIDREAGRWRPADVFTTAPGAGPRHLDFGPDGRYAYLVNELDGSLSVLSVNSETGALTHVQTVSLLPEGFDGFNKSADVHVHPAGSRVYASNRGDFDSIAVLDIDPSTGRVTLSGHTTDGIAWPRHFAFDASGRLMFVANRTSNEVLITELDPETGMAASTLGRIGVPEPTNVTLVPPNGR